jgi:hypothetical protein
LIEHGDYEELHGRLSGTVIDSLRGFDRGVRGREAIDPQAAKAPDIRHADGGGDRQGGLDTHAYIAGTSERRSSLGCAVVQVIEGGNIAALFVTRKVGPLPR